MTFGESNVGIVPTKHCLLVKNLLGQETFLIIFALSHFLLSQQKKFSLKKHNIIGTLKTFLVSVNLMISNKVFNEIQIL